MKWLLLLLLNALGIAQEDSAEAEFCDSLAEHTNGRITCDDLYEWAEKYGLDTSDGRTGISNGF